MNQLDVVSPNVLTAGMALSPTEQYTVVYEGIVSVARRCDGAVTEDGVGFNGQDTHFGRRIASVPFSEWTSEICIEAARIALTYKVQILNYTGQDMAALDVVREARELKTLHVARDQARAIERKGSAKIAARKAVKTPEGKLVLTWDKKDPDCFGALLAGVKALPGRRWTGSVNEVDFTPEAVAFIEEFALAADFDLEIAKVDAEAAVKAEAERPRVTLKGKDRVIIDAGGYNADRVNDARSLPGRRFISSTKCDEVDLHPAVLTFAKKWNLVVAPEVLKALDAAQANKLSEQTVADMLTHASRQASPENLPPAFEALVNARLAEARA